MSDTKKGMSFKGFIAKATKPNVSAAAFLKAHRDYMTTGELSPILSPVLNKVDMGELLPTPALNVIAAAVMNHIIASDLKKLDDKLNQPAPKAKPWTVSIFDHNHVIQTRVTEQGEVEELIKGFDDASSADRWSMRQLVDGGSDWYAEIKHTSLPIHTRMERSEALATLLKKPKGPSVHQKATTTKSLGFGVSCKQDRSSFSRG